MTQASKATQRSRAAGGVDSRAADGSGGASPRRSARLRPHQRRPAHQSSPLVGAVVSVALFAVFLVLALMCRPDSTLSAWDRAVSDAFVAWRTPGRSEFFWGVTLIGNFPVLAALSTSAVFLLAAWGKRGWALLVGAGMLIGWGISEAAKAIVDRPRPPEVDALIAMPSSASMPSGHALTTLVFLGLLVYLAFRRSRPGAPGRRAVVWTLAFSAGVVVVLVGLSRVYLGVHWLSDVLGGWFLGAAWVAAFAGTATARSRVARFFADPRPPARVAIRVVIIMLAVIACVVAIVLTARADPLLTDL